MCSSHTGRSCSYLKFGAEVMLRMKHDKLTDAYEIRVIVAVNGAMVLKRCMKRSICVKVRREECKGKVMMGGEMGR